MKYKGFYTSNEIYDLEFYKGKYLTNDTLAVQILGTLEGENFAEPFCMLTVNLETRMNFPENYAFIDVNNCPRKIIAQLETENKIIPTGMLEWSGFVAYPLYEFSQEFLNEMKII